MKFYRRRTISTVGESTQGQTIIIKYYAPNEAEAQGRYLGWVVSSLNSKHASLPSKMSQTNSNPLTLTPERQLFLADSNFKPSCEPPASP